MKMITRFLSILFIMAFIFTAGCVEGDSRRTEAAPPRELDVTQMFVLKNLSDELVRLEDLLKQNKAVLINFWATWCPPCREEIPDLIELQEKYKDSSFTVLGIDVGESKTKVSGFVEKMEINYPVVLDEDMSVTESYKVVGIPTTYLVNSEGKILGTYHAVTQELLDDVAAALQ